MGPCLGCPSGGAEVRRPLRSSATSWWQSLVRRTEEEDSEEGREAAAPAPTGLPAQRLDSQAALRSASQLWLGSPADRPSFLLHLS